MKHGADSGRGAVYAASRVFLDADTVRAPGALAVSGGAVVAAGSPGDVTRGLPAGFERVELPGAAILPGLVNAHTHLQIPRLEGARQASSPPLDFVEWILRVIAWKRGAAPEEFRRNFEGAAAEALAAGTTAVGEIAGPDRDVYRPHPMRMRVFAEGIGFAPEAAAEVLSAVEATVDALEGFGREDETLAPGVSPHTLYTVGPVLLGLLGELAARKALPTCLHLAESPAEMEFLRTGGGPVAERLYPAVGKDVSWFHGVGAPLPEYLRKASLLREGLLLVHNVHLSTEEIDALRQGGARFVLCPRSNAALGNGQPDLTRFVDAAVPFALGTDSLGSVDSLDMWEEMRHARSLYRGKLPEKELCRSLFRAATENGAAALGLPGGTLRPGGPADFTAVDDPGGAGSGGAARKLLERTEKRSVRWTVVAGRRRYGNP